ncbi:MAG: hypothetical protein HYY23_15280 [Verrucomicrobia bacterium]|nr:hypothetical protein [Verrucomicrobiota bacterium]
MPAKWVFRELRRGDKDRQPTQGEFFSTEAIRSVAEALVRESIQNSLDASLKTGSTPVQVRFHLATGPDALPARTVRQYFADGWKHFRAQDNGLDDVPQSGDSCPFLVIEDFGTTGLVGDITQYRNLPNTNNPFYYFFRTEGRSGKGEQDRGRWGIGKYVFPRSSRINAFFALTVRKDDSNRFLMGQAVLKSHVVGNRYYTPDGDYGEEASDGLVMPTSEEGFLNRICEDFSISRRNEPGLSVVVPWVVEEIMRDAILQAVVKGYFFPILCGGLEVSVAEAGQETRVDRDTLATVCRQFGEEFEKEMLPLVNLTIWARDSAPSETIRLNRANAQRPKWEPKLIPDDKLTELRAKYRAGQKLALEIPLTVLERDHPTRESFFKVFLVKEGTEEGAPVFIRDGIIIADVRGRWVSGVRALVVIDHPPLAKLLGDSENPAHTQWQKDREHFKFRYTFGKSYIDFVTQSVSMFVRYLNESDEEPDRDLLREIFSIPKRPETEEPKEKATTRKRKKGEVVKPDPKPEPRLRRYTLSKVTSGFSITRGHAGAPIPSEIRIAAAYDRRRGGPLAKYSPADFKLNEAPLAVEVSGGEIIEKQLNRLVVSILEPDFRVTVTGFDENRDLFVDVDAKEAPNDSKA